MKIPSTCKSLVNSATISDMGSRVLSREQGSLVLPLALTGSLLILALIFGGWAFAQMLDYKTASDAKVARAVTIAKAQEDIVKDAAFAEADKQPLRTYKGPMAFGSVTISYPKTWSAYIPESQVGSPYIDGYFYPGVVPSIQAQNSVFALRVQVESNNYSDELSQFTDQVKTGTTKVSPFQPPKVPGVVGAKIAGKLSGNVTGSMILLPMRNMTLKVWTEAPQFQNDFDNIIIPNFTFAP